MKDWDYILPCSDAGKKIAADIINNSDRPISEMWTVNEKIYIKFKR